VVWKRLLTGVNRINDSEEYYLTQVGLMLLLSLILSAAIFRPNFTALDVWVVFGLAVGISRIIGYSSIKSKYA
jgi:uncharacterized membrane protein YcaP (DUF421 family)